MALTRVDGVEKAVVSYEAGMATVAYDPQIVTPSEFIDELVAMTGYGAEVSDDPGLPFVGDDDIGLHEDVTDHDHQEMSDQDSTRRD